MTVPGIPRKKSIKRMIWFVYSRLSSSPKTARIRLFLLARSWGAAEPTILLISAKFLQNVGPFFIVHTRQPAAPPESECFVLCKRQLLELNREVFLIAKKMLEVYCQRTRL